MAVTASHSLVLAWVWVQPDIYRVEGILTIVIGRIEKGLKNKENWRIYTEVRKAPYRTPYS